MPSIMHHNKKQKYFTTNTPRSIALLFNKSKKQRSQNLSLIKTSYACLCMECIIILFLLKIWKIQIIFNIYNIVFYKSFYCKNVNMRKKQQKIKKKV